jgi:hypothetical protein
MENQVNDKQDEELEESNKRLRTTRWKRGGRKIRGHRRN